MHFVGVLNCALFEERRPSFGRSNCEHSGERRIRIKPDIVDEVTCSSNFTSSIQTVSRRSTQDIQWKVLHKKYEELTDENGKIAANTY